MNDMHYISIRSVELRIPFTNFVVMDRCVLCCVVSGGSGVRRNTH